MSKSVGKLLPAVAGLLGGSSMGALASALGGATSTSAAPTVAAPSTMPDPMAGAQAKRKKAMEAAKRGGRMSTILTDDTTDTLGG